MALSYNPYQPSAPKRTSYGSLLGQRGNAMASAYGVKPTPTATGGKVSMPPPSKPVLPGGSHPSFPDVPETPAAPSSFAPQSAPGGGGGFVDPALAQIRALAARSRSEATARALAKKKQAAVEYGDASGVTGLDEATAKAAKDNPFSILKGLDRNYNEGVGRLEDALNKSNLFYSGHRGTELGKAATNYQQDKYGASTRFQAGITDIEDALAQALLQADMMEMQALMGSGGPYGGGGDNGAGFVGRPGEANPAGVPVVEGWDPSRNSDAKYDISGLTQVGPDRWVDPFGWMYDSNGRRV